MAESESKAAQELTELLLTPLAHSAQGNPYGAEMETTMQNLQTKLHTISDQIVSRMDEMGTRIDDLEKNVADLMTQAGMEEHQTMK